MIQGFAKLLSWQIGKDGLGWFAGISDQIRPYGVRQPGTRHNYDHAACTKQIRDREILTAMTAKAGNSLELTYFGHKTEFRCEPYISQARELPPEKDTYTGQNWHLTWFAPLQGQISRRSGVRHLGSAAHAE